MKISNNQRENSFVSDWLNNRLAQDPSSKVLKAFANAFEGNIFNELLLLKVLEELGNNEVKDSFS